MKTELRDEVPWSDRLTEYDNAHFTLYLKLLDACADNASEEEMARDILGIDPMQEPTRARKAVRSHLDRTQWLIASGHRELFPS
ncbi:DNA -binding domain-containing protein [Mesorhizobium sp. NPDC059054]|uniref:DNA -binding domain-containing protein n=1 Tax=Mesorhizobium sp. NPDC059054 TaxID=3346711 RepID=UPI00369A618B